MLWFSFRNTSWITSRTTTFWWDSPRRRPTPSGKSHRAAFFNTGEWRRLQFHIISFAVPITVGVTGRRGGGGERPSSLEMEHLNTRPMTLNRKGKPILPPPPKHSRPVAADPGPFIPQRFVLAPAVRNW